MTQETRLAPIDGGNASGVGQAIPLPKRGGPKGLLPSTWAGRSLHISYRDCFNEGQETSGILLDVFPAGPVFGIDGCRTLVSWDRLCLIALVDPA